MDKSAIRNFSIEARKILMKSAETEAGFYGVTRKGCKSPIQKGNDFEVYETLAGTENRIYGADIKKRANLVEAVETLGFDQVIEETAYTWFNRIIAIRFMEVNGYLPTRVRVLSSETGSNTPDIVTQSLDVDLNMTPEELEKVQKAKDENRYDDAFRMLFVKQCNELNAILPGLFEKTDDYMELLLKLSYTSDGVVRMLVDTVAEDNFNVETEGQVEIIGWMYQYYNTELKDDTFAKLKKNVKITKERIPAATQLFTPDWIVRYMVENSVGRVWIEHLRAIDSSIDEKAKAEEFGWKYYLPEADQETEVQENLVEIRKSYLNLEPKDITCIDPCMGSGHILVYMFDVLMDIYRSEGFSERDAAFSILENNIRGLDIDRRAYQLSYFALMMKARGYNRLFFRGMQSEDGERRFIEPVVFAIEESNDIKREQLKYFGANLNESEKNIALNQMNELLEALKDAKEYGSILKIDNYDWVLLENFAIRENADRQISFETFGIDETKKKIQFLIQQGRIMSQNYWVVSTNPPYMGITNGNVKLNEFAKKMYPDSKADLFAVFIEKCGKMLYKAGFQAMITMQAWMFLSGYEKLRKIVMEKEFINMIHLGARAFDEISGEVVQTTAFIIKNGAIDNYNGIYFRLTDEKGESNKEIAYLSQRNRFTVKKTNFEEIPKLRFAYWIDGNKVFNYNMIKSMFTSGGRNKTHNNDKYVRNWWEILFDERKWKHYDNGGNCRKWYGNCLDIVDWSEQAKAFYKSHGGLLKDEVCNLVGISWNGVSGNNYGFKLKRAGFAFSSSSPTIVCEDNIVVECVLGLLNSNVAPYVLDAINPTLQLNVGEVLDFPMSNQILSASVLEKVRNNIDLSKEDWDSFEISWDYKRDPLVNICTRACNDSGEKNKIKDCFFRWKEVCEHRYSVLKTNEENLNKIFINIYNLQNNLLCDVNERSISIHKAEVKDDIKYFISYAVGCMFGRYSLDVEGIIFAGGEWNLSAYKSYIPDSDGIIPINDSEYFKDDIVSRFEEFVRAVYGTDNLEENLNFIANALDIKGRTSREIIRNYFINEFYKDHCNMYAANGSGKRPIYWLFDSGKQNGFKCLIYMHRYTRDTLNLIRSEYLHKTEDVVENALKNAEYIIQTSSSAVEKAIATKDRDKYVKQLNEMRIYYQALSHLAIQRIEINLDDGVKNNYQVFQGIEVISDGGKKQIVDLLAKI